jgi:hypothetical protein
MLKGRTRSDVFSSKALQTCSIALLSSSCASFSVVGRALEAVLSVCRNNDDASLIARSALALSSPSSAFISCLHIAFQSETYFL